jgi:4-hydroxythreonine-4-phosphate dehydrogenase
MTAGRPVLAVTTGEPAGIGPEIAVAAAARLIEKQTGLRIVLLGDRGLLAERVQDHSVRLVNYRADVDVDVDVGVEENIIEVLHLPLAVPSLPGRLDACNGRYVLNLIDRAMQGAMAKEFAALVTAPVQKSTINDAGIAFIGHTEYLAEHSATAQVVMLLAGQPKHGSSAMFRVALASTHLPLKDVPAAISYDSLLETLTILNTDLRNKFGIAQPRILVTGLNPHAGESGYLGREEIEVITPVLKAARQRGIDARGPFPADTLFQPRYLDDCDAVLAMYHDQGLPVLKYATFGQGVNITLGLPFIRTSVDHGTALDLAGTGKADAGSLLAALEVAAAMAAEMAASVARSNVL